MMDNETGLAMSDAVRSNATLQTFTFHAGFKKMMDNETGLAMADAVRRNTTLQAFTFHADYNNMIDNATLLVHSWPSCRYVR